MAPGRLEPEESDRLLRVAETDDALVETIDPSDRPPAWKDYPPPREVQAVGDRWVAEARSAALRVPSVIVPSEFNYVLNPGHTDFARVGIAKVVPFPFDARLGAARR